MKFKDYDPAKPDTLLQNEQPTTLQGRRRGDSVTTSAGRR